MVCVDPGGYFRVDPLTGRLYNARPLLLSDPNWSSGNMTITVQVSDTRLGLLTSILVRRKLLKDQKTLELRCTCTDYYSEIDISILHGIASL